MMAWPGLALHGIGVDGCVSVSVCVLGSATSLACDDALTEYSRELHGLGSYPATPRCRWRSALYFRHPRGHVHLAKILAGT